MGISIHDSCLEIGEIEIKVTYQNQKFGQEALQTLLGIYNAEKRAHLPFKHFCLTTTTYNIAALKCYEKCGFKVVGASDNYHYAPPGWVYLSQERSLKS